MNDQNTNFICMVQPVRPYLSTGTVDDDENADVGGDLREDVEGESKQHWADMMDDDDGNVVCRPCEDQNDDLVGNDAGADARRQHDGA